MAFTRQSTVAAGSVVPASLNRDAKLNGANTITPAASAVNGSADNVVLKVVEIGGAKTHVANPSARGTVMFFPDGYGDENALKIIDYLQNQGFFVLVLDFSLPEGAPPKDMHLLYREWVASQHDRIRQMIPNWLQGVQDRFGTEQFFFTVGCGFGATLALEACAASDSGPEIIAGAVMHPDHVETSHILNIDKPVLFSFTNTSDPLDREVRPWLQSILAGPRGNPKVKYSIQLFATDLPDVSPGRNPKVENEEYAVLETARAMTEWFKRAAQLKTGPQ